MPSTTKLIVKQPVTLIDFLLDKMGGMSRTSVKQLLTHRQVSVNGKITTLPVAELQPGDEVSVRSGLPSGELHHPKVRVVYEDEHLIVVEKREGLLTVATHAGSTQTTVFSILKQYVRRSNPRGSIYTVHRLDRETSGLLVFAKTKELQEYMREWWHEIVTRRTYVAVAEGVFDKQEGTIVTWLTEDKRNAVVYSSPVDDGGKKAITHYRVESQKGQPPLPLLSKEGNHQEQSSMEGNRQEQSSMEENRQEQSSMEGNRQEQSSMEGNLRGAEQVFSLVELNLETGRTNQIRVHLASIGHPVAGDRKYGSGMQCPIDRLALHARVLEFIHPVTEQTLHFETPVPKEFLRLVK